MTNLNLEICADILSEKKYEPVMVKIFQHPIGAWLPLHVVMGLTEYKYEKSIIHVLWTQSLYNEEGFSLVVFCEEDDMSMLTGSYNVGRLFREIQSS